MYGSLGRLRRPLFTRVALHALRGSHHISHERASPESGHEPCPFSETLVGPLRWFQEVGYLSCPAPRGAR